MIHNVCLGVIRLLVRELKTSSLEESKQEEIAKELSFLKEQTGVIQYSFLMPAEEQIQHYISMLIRLTEIGYIIENDFVFPYELFIFRDVCFVIAIGLLHKMNVSHQGARRDHDIYSLSIQYCAFAYWDLLFGTSLYKSQRRSVLDSLDTIALEISGNQSRFREFMVGNF